MPHQFYLSSHDFSRDPQPRKCEFVSEVEGMRPNSHYFLVKVDPPVITRFWGGPAADFDRLVLAMIGKDTPEGIGTKSDIVICPTYSGGRLDERACSRIGVGALYQTYADALKGSPVEEE